MCSRNVAAQMLLRLVLALPSATQEALTMLVDDLLQPKGYIANEALALHGCDCTPNLVYLSPQP